MVEEENGVDHDHILGLELDQDHHHGLVVQLVLLLGHALDQDRDRDQDQNLNLDPENIGKENDYSIEIFVLFSLLFFSNLISVNKIIYVFLGLRGSTLPNDTADQDLHIGEDQDQGQGRGLLVIITGPDHQEEGLDRDPHAILLGIINPTIDKILEL